jgi:Fic family protein
LEGVAASREKVEAVLAGSAADANPEDKTGIVPAVDAIKAVRSLAGANGRAASLTPALMIKLHSGSHETELLHKNAGGDELPLEAAAAKRVAKLESACHWFAAESFAELHPAEQSSIVLMRLIELRPFDDGNTRTALAASSLFTLRSELPPIIIKPEMEAAYRAALNDGMRMNTKPMVDLVTEALLRTLSEMIERVGSR